MKRSTWRKSSYRSDQGGNCVEVVDLDTGSLAVRDSKNPFSPALMVPTAEWVVFTAGVRAGEFD